MDAVDVFIPFHVKDAAPLPLVVRSLFQHLRPRPARVVCVGTGLSPELTAQIQAHGGEVLEERAVTEIPAKADLPAITVAGQPRTGWYYQQFLKWGFRRLARTPAYVVMDADTVLVAPLVLWQDGRYVLDRTDQFHPPYFATFERLLGWRPERQDSFIINYQILDVALVDELIATIRGADGADWVQRILATIDRTEVAAFSEFETYGYWLSRTHPERFTSRPGANVGSRAKRLAWHPLIGRLARWRGATTVSYHQVRNRT